MGAVAKSYMKKGFLKYAEIRKYLVIYEEAVTQIYDFSTTHFWISLYMRKILFSFSISLLCSDDGIEREPVLPILGPKME
jgi:hypothetical protein